MRVRIQGKTHLVPNADFSELSPAQVLQNLIASPSTGAILPPVPNGGTWSYGVYRYPNLEWIQGYLNIYFLQNLSTASTGLFLGNFAVVNKYTSIATLVHEIGHTLGLGHTFSGNNIEITCLCNDPEALYPTTDPGSPYYNVRLCELVQDYICDTPIDPHSNNLDGVGGPDGPKWVKNCKQLSQLNSYADGCDDKEHWDIPFTNYMSYYDECRITFSPCQKSLMHSIIDEFLEHLVTSCDSYPYFSTEDIIINEPTTWSNNTLPMKVNQKIIITETGSLTLNNYVITRAPSAPPSPSSSCPDLHQPNLWDGIYILSGNRINGDGTLGSLNVLSNSIIEYAEYGINAPNGFGKIIIDNSIIRKCGRILDVRDSWPLNEDNSEYLPALGSPSSPIYCDNPLKGVPKVIITNHSTVNCEDIGSVSGEDIVVKPILLTTQLKLNGVYLYVNSSLITNSSPKLRYAINSSGGAVKIVNGSKISGFDIGVIKDGDFFGECLYRGLQVSGSSIINCDNAIRNTSASMQLFYNYFGSTVQTSGLGYHYVFRNKFINNLYIRDPIESSLIKANCFGPFAYADIDGFNKYTNFLCNNWSGSIAANINDGTSLMPSWGSSNKSSGNFKTALTIFPLMAFDGDLDINMPNNFINYYEEENDLEEFSYDGIIEGVESPDAGCPPFDCPISAPSPIIGYEDSIISLIEKEHQYHLLDSTIASNESQLGNFSGSNLARKIEVIEQQKVDLKNILSDVYHQISKGDSLAFVSWAPRYNPLIQELSDLKYFLYTQQFDSIRTRLQYRSDEDSEEFIDAINLIDSISYNYELSIRELPTDVIQLVAYMATESFGDYTNILRSYLNMEYNIYIPWPDTIEIRSVNTSKQSVNKQIEKFVVYPNPTNSCFHIKSKTGTSNDEDSITVGLFNLSGVMLKQYNGILSDEYCFSETTDGLYLLKITNDISLVQEFKLISFIK